MKEDVQCVCCNKEGEEWLSTSVFHEDSSGEWWCQQCIEKCIPTHQAIADGEYSIEENE